MATQRTFTAEETQKKFESLPPEVKELLYSAEMNAAIQKVGEKNKLHYDQMGRLEMETTNVLLGFTETADYPGILVKTLSVDETQANAIVKDVNDTLFIKIRNAMKKGPVEAPQKISAPPAVAAPAAAEKSVVMPSAAKAPTPVAAPVAPAATPAPAPTMQTVPAIVKPAGLPMMQHVDAMLEAPTVSIAPKPATPPMQTVPAATPATPAAPTPAVASTDAKVEPPKPGPIYKTDPYHEPID